MVEQWLDITTAQWVDDNTFQWYIETAGAEGLNCIWTDDAYVYAATSEGLDIVDVASELKVSWDTSRAYTAVWANEASVYLGTSGQGIKILLKSSIAPGDVGGFVTDYLNAPVIQSDEIVNLHGSGPTLMACTSASVEIIRMESNYITRHSVEGSKKCFVTETDKFYYLVSDAGSCSLSRLDGNFYDWVDANETYTTGSRVLIDSGEINDFFVTSGTSISGALYNTLFVATTSGIYVFDEGSDDHFSLSCVSCGGPSDYKIIGGSSINYASVWAEEYSGTYVGKLYVATAGVGAALSVVNLETKELVDCYSENVEGRSGDLLEGNDIHNLNVKG